MINVSTVLGKIIAASVLVALTGLVLLFTQLVIQEPPMPGSARAVVTPTVVPGGNFILRNGLTASTPCAALIYRAVFDSSGTRIFAESEFRPGTGAIRKDGTNRVVELRTIPIPTYAALGRADYNVVVEWQCNFVQRLWPQVRELPDLTFEIVAPSKP